MKIEVNELSVKIVEDYKKGSTLEELSKKYGFSLYFIRNIIRDSLSNEEIKKIVRNRKNTYFTDEEINYIVYLYENGIETKSQLGKRFKLNKKRIENLLLKNYKKYGINYIPTVVSETAFLKMLYNSNYTKDQMVEKAKKAKKIIPQYLLEKYYKKEMDIDKVRQYVIKQYTTVEQQDDDLKKNMFKSFNIASILKNKNLGLEYQIVALLYSLPQTTGDTIEELSKVVDGDEEIINAINVLNSKDKIEEEYINDLQNNKIAVNVKIAEKIEEVKQLSLEEIPVNLLEHYRYYEISKSTELKEEYEKVIKDNKKLIKIKEEKEH